MWLKKFGLLQKSMGLINSLKAFKNNVNINLKNQPNKIKSPLFNQMHTGTMNRVKHFIFMYNKLQSSTNYTFIINQILWTGKTILYINKIL